MNEILMSLFFRLQWRVRWYRIMWFKHLTSFDLLELALSSTRLVKQSGDKAMLVDWLKNYLIPNLDQVRDWAQEVIADYEQST